MLLLALDISSHTGFSIFENGNLKDYGVLHTPNPNPKSPFPKVAYDWAKINSTNIVNQINTITKSLGKIDYIVIEKLNNGYNRDVQSFLEYTHCLLYQSLIDLHLADKVCYMNTSEWRKLVDLKLSNEDKKNNKLPKSKKVPKITKKHLAVRICNELYNLKLLKKDHDIADSLLLGQAFLNKRNNK